MKRTFLSLFLIFCVKIVQAQSITISPTGITPVQSAYPRLTFAQIQAKTDMTIGDLAYDLTFYCLRMYNGHEWIRFLNAQPNVGEATAFGFNGPSTFIYDVAHDSQNNIYILGIFNTSLVLSPTVTLTGSAENESLFIAKFNTAGTLLAYTKEQATNYSLYPSDLHIDSNDNVYVCGGYSGTVAFGGIYNCTSTNNSIDVFIAKYNSSLVIQWAISNGGAGEDLGLEIATEPNGNVFIGGYFEGTISFDGGGVQQTSAGGYDVFLTKYTSTGTFVWANSFGGTNYDFVNDMYYDGYDNLYLTGTFATATTIGTDAYTSNGEGDFFVAKFNKNGVYRKSFAGGGTGDDAGNTIIADSQGSIYVGGAFQNTVTLNGIDHVSKGGYDVFLANFYEEIGVNARSIASNLLLGFFYTFGSNDASIDDFITDATNDSAGNIYITGTTSGTLPIEGFSTTINYGTFLWKRNHDSKTTALFSYSITYPCITKDNIGNVFLGGKIDSSTTIGTTFLNVPTGMTSDVLVRVRLN